MVVLKIAYDENLQGISPGKFIHREILKRLFQEGKTRTLEWYGRVHEWQKKLGSVREPCSTSISTETMGTRCATPNQTTRRILDRSVNR